MPKKEQRRAQRIREIFINNGILEPEDEIVGNPLTFDHDGWKFSGVPIGLLQTPDGAVVYWDGFGMVIKDTSGDMMPPEFEDLKTTPREGYHILSEQEFKVLTTELEKAVHSYKKSRSAQRSAVAANNDNVYDTEDELQDLIAMSPQNLEMAINTENFRSEEERKMVIGGLLIEHAKRNNQDHCFVLLKMGASPRFIKEDDETALMHAAYHANLELCKALLDAGATDVMNIPRISNGLTPIQLIIQQDRSPRNTADLCLLFLEANANRADIIEYADSLPDCLNKTRIVMAIKYKEEEENRVVQVRPQAPAGPSGIGSGYSSEEDYHDSSSIEEDNEDAPKQPAIRIESLKSLIKNEEISDEIIAQEIADKIKKERNSESLGKVLVYAAKCNRVKTCAALIKKGASLEQRDEDGENAIIWAARNLNVNLCEVLLANGANRVINQQTQDNLNTPILAIFDQFKRCDDSRDDDEMQSDRCHICCLLTKAGADLELKNAKGMSPLRMAVEMKDYNLTDNLLKLGANPHAECDDGITPTQKAEKNAEDCLEESTSIYGLISRFNQLHKDKATPAPSPKNPGFITRLISRFLGGFSPRD